MKPQDLLDAMQERMKDSMVGTLGVEVSLDAESQVCGRMPVDRRTIQPMGRLHGGASVALAETLGSVAGNCQVDFPNEYCVGLEVNANHLKSATGGFVHGVALPIKLGKKIQVWDIRIRDEDGNLICISRLTLAVLRNNG